MHSFKKDDEVVVKTIGGVNVGTGIITRPSVGSGDDRLRIKLEGVGFYPPSMSDDEEFCQEGDSWVRVFKDPMGEGKCHSTRETRYLIDISQFAWAR